MCGCVEVIQLNVTSLDVEPDEDEDTDDGQSCSYDRLQLFDGHNVDSDPLSARLCGHVAPKTTFLTSSNAACINFRSDYFTVGTGFQLNYHVVVPHRTTAHQLRTGTILELDHDKSSFFQSTNTDIFKYIKTSVSALMGGDDERPPSAHSNRLLHVALRHDAA